jgi:hypothetical protein
MVLLKTWGDRWLRQGRGTTSRFVCVSTGETTRAIVIVPATGEPADPADVRLVPIYLPDGLGEAS